jgi:hypothetical protein
MPEAPRTHTVQPRFQDGSQLQAPSQANTAAGPSPHEPPPPPSFTRPQMPPPSSPPQQHPHASQMQRPQYALNFGANRELPGLGQALRPGSSMSISSLIGGGGDTGAPVQTTQSHPSPPTNAPSSNGHSMQPPSPRRGVPSGQRSEFAPFRRPSPDRGMYGGGISRPTEGQHAFPVGSPRQSYSNHGSPELGRQSLPPTTHPYNPMNFSGQRLYSPGDANRQTSGNMPPRPNSQPTGPLGNPEQEGRSMYDALGGRRSAFGPPEERRRTLGESHHARPNAVELLAGVAQSASERDRPVTVHPVSQSLFSPPRENRNNMQGSTEPPRSLWRHSTPNDVAREPPHDARQEERSALQRSYGSYPPPTLGAPRYGPYGPEDMLRRVDQLSHRVVEQYHAPPTSDPNSVERHRTEPLARSLSSRSLYDQPPKMGEAMQHSKSHIGFGLEASRRTGRASPLPQAVQGAQAQPLSIGKDPGIKSEFGRMFSGLGSGLGSSTPSRGSPMPQNAQGLFESDAGEMMRRVSSQQGRKPKRVKDEEGIFDVDSADGRGTPSGARGAKRNKHHHHHVGHHQYVHPHSYPSRILTG